jgi:LAS superfamily LD-carboxypeptidase LdcB
MVRLAFAAMVILALAAEFAAGKVAARKPCGKCSQGVVRRASRCNPRGYVDPAIAKNLNAALREMRRAGIKPRITSTWRSSAQQQSLHRCSLNRRCRHQRGLYGAARPGQSAHEAGFAVDMAGIAAGPRGAKRLTPQGRHIIRIMQKHGFQWRYGLLDPVHFEANPRRYGYRNLKEAIARNQARCNLASNKSHRRSRLRPEGGK